MKKISLVIALVAAFAAAAFPAAAANPKIEAPVLSVSYTTSPVQCPLVAMFPDYRCITMSLKAKGLPPLEPVSIVTVGCDLDCYYWYDLDNVYSASASGTLNIRVEQWTQGQAGGGSGCGPGLIGNNRYLIVDGVPTNWVFNIC